MPTIRDGAHFTLDPRPRGLLSPAPDDRLARRHSVPAFLTPAFATVAALLLVAGLAKLRRPERAARALAIAGLPGGAGAARTLGAAEAIVGAACLIAPGPALAAVLAAAYGAFALVVLRLRAARASCGCFGAEDVPAGGLHAALDLAAAAVAALGAAAGVHGLPWVAERATAVVVVGSLAIAAAVSAGHAAFTALPAAWAAWTSTEAP
jgi:hypothetical protein